MKSAPRRFIESAWGLYDFLSERKYLQVQAATRRDSARNRTKRTRVSDAHPGINVSLGRKSATRDDHRRAANRRKFISSRAFARPRISLSGRAFGRLVGVS